MRKALLGLAAISTLGYAGYSMFGDSESTIRSNEQLVLDRLWVDHIPRSERDTFQVFMALTEEPVGVFQAASRWRGDYELFQHETQGGEMRILYPHTGERETAKVKATECNEGQMDFCLEIHNASRGVKKYYSREGWEIGAKNIDQVRTQVDALLKKK